MSETLYQQLDLPPLKLLQRTTVRSASGSSLAPVGMVKCMFTLGDQMFSTEFIVCKHLMRPLILGEDFLRQNQIGIYYSEIGKCVLGVPT